MHTAPQDGYTALHDAAEEALTTVVKALLAKGASVNARTEVRRRRPNPRGAAWPHSHAAPPRPACARHASQEWGLSH